MIRYTLNCAKGHTFESWFQSSAAYEKLVQRHLIRCAVCGERDVKKAIMAPRVAKAAGRSTAAETDQTGVPAGSDRNGKPAKASAMAERAAIAELRKKIETNADYVGTSFAAEARAIHDGEAPSRSIWGEARLPEARALVRDGVSVMPLPFVPARKMN